MQIVVGGEGEEPSYSLKLISAALWSLLLCTQEHALTQCALHVTGMVGILQTADVLDRLD